MFKMRAFAVVASLLISQLAESRGGEQPSDLDRVRLLGEKPAPAENALDSASDGFFHETTEVNPGGARGFLTLATGKRLLEREANVSESSGLPVRCIGRGDACGNRSAEAVSNKSAVGERGRESEKGNDFEHGETEDVETGSGPIASIPKVQPAKAGDDERKRPALEAGEKAPVATTIKPAAAASADAARATDVSSSTSSSTRKPAAKSAKRPPRPPPRGNLPAPNLPKPPSTLVSIPKGEYIHIMYDGPTPPSEGDGGRPQLGPLTGPPPNIWVCHRHDCFYSGPRGDFIGELGRLCDSFNGLPEGAYCNRCPEDTSNRTLQSSHLKEECDFFPQSLAIGGEEGSDSAGLGPDGDRASKDDASSDVKETVRDSKSASKKKKINSENEYIEESTATDVFETDRKDSGTKTSKLVEASSDGEEGVSNDPKPSADISSAKVVALQKIPGSDSPNRPSSILKSESCAPAAADAEEPFRMAFLFFTRNGTLVLEEVWTRWMAAGIRWGRQKMRAKHPPFHNSEETGAGTVGTALFSVYVHSADPESNTTLLSARLRQRLGVEIVEIPHSYGAWGNLNHIQHHLLVNALEDKRNAAFTLISDTTIPVASFSHIYRSFFANQRSRFAFSKVPLPLFYRKHSQWIVLNRRHARALAENPQLWVCPQWAYSPPGTTKWKKGIAAPDEFLPYYALQRVFGVNRIQEEVNNGHVFPVNVTGVSLFNPAFVENDFNHTFVDWDGSFGDNLPGKKPAWYYNLHGEFLERLVDAPQIWFFRKVMADCTVSYAHSPEVREPMENVLDRLLIDVE